MDSKEPSPRGLVSRCLIAALIFGAAVLPGWMLAEFAESLTGSAVLGFLISAGWCGAAVAVLAPRVSYRRVDAVVGAVPLLGWYLICVLAWRAAFLPFRDWEPRPEEQRRARWLMAHEHLGVWRMDRVRLATGARPATSADRRTAGGRRPARTDNASTAGARTAGARAGSARTDSARIGPPGRATAAAPEPTLNPRAGRDRPAPLRRQPIQRDQLGPGERQ